jgi:hypothetical protein
LGIRIFFLEKNHNPPFKLNGCSLNACNRVKNNIELKCWKEDGIREDISKVVINLESDNESDSESNELILIISETFQQNSVLKK